MRLWCESYKSMHVFVYCHVWDSAINETACMRVVDIVRFPSHQN